MTGVVGDLRLAVRRLRRSPSFALTAVLSLALGIGANITVFSVVHGVLLSPLPYPQPDRLVQVLERRAGVDQPASLLSFDGWRDAAAGTRGMAAVRRWPYNVTGGEQPYRVTGVQGSSGLLAVLGARPFRGREFTRGDELAGADPVCIVSHAFWTERLGARTDLASRRLVLDGLPHAVVGVLPEGFTIPGFGTPPILTPTPLDARDASFGSNHNAVVIARLADGVSLDSAGARVSVVASRLAATFPRWNDGIGARLVPVRDALVAGVRRPLWVLFGAVALVLLVACVNLAGVLLARAAAAEREAAVRVALGASRLRIVRLALSETLVVSMLGALAGLWIGAVGVDSVARLLPGGIPRLDEVAIDLPVVVFTVACVLGTALLLGLVPALRSSRTRATAILGTSRRATGLAVHTRTQRALVVAEVAIAVVLLTSAGLLLRSFVNVIRADPGFATDGRVVMAVSLPRARYPDRARVTAFLDEVDRRLGAIPGVRASGASVGLPLGQLAWRKHMTLEGRPAPSLPEVPVVDVSIVTPGYLPALGIRLLRGRALSGGDGDRAGFAALVNEAFVRQYLPGQDPMGRRFRLAPPDALLPREQTGAFPWYAIVGVVADVRRWNLAAGAFPEVFIPQTQDADVAREFYLVAHTGMEDPDLPSAMRQAVWAVDADQPVEWVRPLEDLYENAVSRPRFISEVVGAFGLAALLLAAIGVFGLVANIVEARTPEIGLRVALGARARDVVAQVGGPAASAALAGVVLGVAVAAAATRVMASMMVDVGTLDPPTYAVVALAVLAVAVAAAILASLRATRIDAAVALAAG